MIEKKFDYKLFYVEANGKEKTTTGFTYADSSYMASKRLTILIPEDCVSFNMVVTLSA